jgi:hypothetical protein
MKWAAPLLILACAPVQAAESLLCATSVETNGGWSRERITNVTFMSGHEVQGPGINARATYVEIPGAELAGVENTRVMNQPFHKGWFPILFSGRRAVVAVEIDGAERRWRVRCLNQNGSWVDNRQYETK